MLPSRMIELPPSVKLPAGEEVDAVVLRVGGRIVVGQEVVGAAKLEEVVGNGGDVPIGRGRPVAVAATTVPRRRVARAGQPTKSPPTTNVRIPSVRNMRRSRLLENHCEKIQADAPTAVLHASKKLRRRATKNPVLCRLDLRLPNLHATHLERTGLDQTRLRYLAKFF